MVVVIHYGEIGIKGKNRSFFENLLMNNIQKKTGKKPRRESGQLVVEDCDLDVLRKIPGIAYLSPAVQVKLDVEEMKKKAVQFLKGRDFSTFKVQTRRHVKTFKYDSMEINRLVGTAIAEKLDKKPQMKNPDLELKIDVSKEAYLSTDRIEGVGGMPTQKRKKVIGLLSGGFDSPVAAYMMMRRGCEVVLVHFHNENQMKGAVKNKVKQLAEKLSAYQQDTVLYVVPFGKIQQEIIRYVDSPVRMLVYRRIMMILAERIARDHKAKLLVTGDSLSQVASQTLDNLHALYTVAPLPVISPLIGMHKMEIVDIAKEIDTYEISSQPYGDCCSFFIPKHPELKARPSDLDVDLDESLISETLEKVKKYEF